MPITLAMREATHGQHIPARIPSAHSAKTGPSEAQPEPALAGGKKGISIFQLERPPAPNRFFWPGEFTDVGKVSTDKNDSRAGAAAWQTTVALAPGRHRYRFLVDGVWRDQIRSARHRVPRIRHCEVLQDEVIEEISLKP